MTKNITEDEHHWTWESLRWASLRMNITEDDHHWGWTSLGRINLRTSITEDKYHCGEHHRGEHHCGEHHWGRAPLRGASLRWASLNMNITGALYFFFLGRTTSWSLATGQAGRNQCSVFDWFFCLWGDMPFQMHSCTYKETIKVAQRSTLYSVDILWTEYTLWGLYPQEEEAGMRRASCGRCVRWSSTFPVAASETRTSWAWIRLSRWEGNVRRGSLPCMVSPSDRLTVNPDSWAFARGGLLCSCAAGRAPDLPPEPPSSVLKLK